MPNLEPQVTSAIIYELVGLSYDRLTAYDLQRKPTPMLAESWEVSNDEMQIKFNLRKNVQFHSGREFTSDDVKYSLERIRDPKLGVGQLALQSQWFTAIETPDKYTAILTSDQPRPTMFDLFEYLNMVDRVTLDGADAKTKSVGTGPFVFTEWVQGDHASFARNNNYWQSGLPLLDGVRAQFFTDTQPLVVQLEAGAIDMARNPPLHDFARLKGNPAYQAITYPVTDFSAHAVYANASAPPTDNKLVRQALNYALDRQRFVDTILLGIGSVQDLPWSPSSPMYQADKMNQYSFDLEKARSLLAQSGVMVQSIDIYPYPAIPEAAPFAEMYQSDLATIGISLNIVTLSTAAWLTTINSLKYNGLFMGPSVNLHLAPGTLFNLSAPLRPTGNNVGFSDPQYVQLVNEVGTATDQTKLQQIYSQINDMILDQSFAMYLSPQLVTAVAQSSVHDLTPHLHGGWAFTNTWLDA
jgi:peptide/nickel transport system substrate-binding protein